MEDFNILSIISEQDKKIIKENPEDPVAQMIADMEGKIPKKIGERIVKEYKDKNQAYQIGIARTKGDFAKDVFENGYKIFGGEDTSFGISYYDNSYNEILYILHQLVATPYYKGSDKAILFKIPKESINYYEEGKSKPILIPDTETNEFGNGCVRILPEYILGYMSVDKDRIQELVENPNYKDEHDYLHDGLIYDGRVQFDRENRLRNIRTTINPETNKKRKNPFIKAWNKMKEMFSQKNKKMLPPGENNLHIENKSKVMDNYYVGEVKPSQGFLKNKQSPKENNIEEISK